MGREARVRKTLRERVVQAYVEAAREVLPTVFTPDCCLNGTRVCIEALKFHGVSAKPLVVDVIVANEAANRMFEQHDGWPTADEDVKRWMSNGAWVIQIDGHKDARPGWEHHLVAVVSDLIVDSSLGQASRPAKNIELPWVAAFPCGPFLKTQDTIVYDAPNGVTIGLKARPDVTSYMFVSGFQPHHGNMEVAAEVAARMDEILNKETA